MKRKRSRKKQRRPVGSQPIVKPRPANNTTCDVYYNGVSPPAAASVAAVPCCLLPNFREGSEASEGDQAFRYTHVMTCSATVDIRDNYPTAPNSTLFVPDKTGNGWDIVFVETVNRGLPTVYKRIFLDRKSPVSFTGAL